MRQSKLAAEERRGQIKLDETLKLRQRNIAQRLLRWVPADVVNNAIKTPTRCVNRVVYRSVKAFNIGKLTRVKVDTGKLLSKLLPRSLILI